ncbi:transposase [Sphingomonas sp. SORGH_AS_0879]|uniref:IS110 family transposase n=1 Tax=Sphingomonas sp. SORGH_AS_0879 TaxID=3041790 RepID=UPI002785A5C9|nr:transposase [Sphingomonas sp. SORGH_AS_0879]MDQ1229526.1 transposase [Sphingomonas sp. SORGH_AS_0879]
MPQPVVGCDLSRAFIDICQLPSGKTGRIANTPDDIGVWLDTLDHDVRVVFEATSGCDGELIGALATRGHPFSRVNPRQAREFARATGTLAKTDRVDARVLAQMGAALDLPATIPLSPARSRLAPSALRAATSRCRGRSFTPFRYARERFHLNKAAVRELS